MIVVIAVFALAKAVVIVPVGQVHIRTRLGKFQEPMSAGLHFVAPFIDVVSARYPTAKQTVTISAEFVSSDQETVAVELEGRYYVLDAAKAYQNIANVDNAIKALFEATVKNEVERRKGDDFRFERRSIEFSIGDENPCASLMLHVRGTESVIEPLRALCERTDWRAFDTSDGELLDFSRDPGKGLREWLAYRARVAPDAPVRGVALPIEG